MCISWLSTIRKSILFPLFLSTYLSTSIHPSIHPSEHGLTDSYTLVVTWAGFGQTALFKRWYLYPFDTFPLLFEHFLPFCYHRMFLVHSVLFWPQFWNQLLFQVALAPFSEEWCLKPCYGCKADHYDCGFFASFFN